MLDVATSDARLHSLSEENTRLRRAVEELSVLNELARTIAGAGSTDEIIHTLVRRSVQAVDAEQGLVTLAPESTESPLKTYVRTGRDSERGHRFLFTDALLGWMQLNLRPLAISSPSTDPRFSGIEWDAKIRSLLSVPMMVRGSLIAVLTVFNKHTGERFTEDDQRLLAIIGSQSAQVVENARLREQERELLRMRHEVELASVIQRNLLPESSPAIPGYDVAGTTQAAQMVGGDFFDFVERSDGRWSISLGDVCGKGLPASLLMSNVQAILRTHAIGCAAPEECLQVANRLLFESTTTDKFVTLFYAVLDPVNHQLEYANGGHSHPLLFNASGDPRPLGRTDLMLGLTGQFAFHRETLALEPGELLVIFSDGITEAVDADNIQFNEERIIDVVRRSRQESARTIIARVIESVREYSGDRQQDDMTLVVVRRI